MARNMDRPICPQLGGVGSPSLTQLAVPGFPPNPVLVQDEFACLNLNILKPDTEIAGLPVMVWIHGGGLAVGSNSELVYTGKELVRRSMKAGMPVIYVAINYRLGPFGFLSSKQLLEENGGKAVGNYGLWDQRLALQFVSDHISAFGGDPNRVTVFGESAGGASVHAHTVSTEALFSQAICQSGVVRSIGPLPPSDPYMDGFYNSFSAQLGKTPPASPETLRKIPARDLVNAAVYLAGGNLPIGIITDDSALPEGFFPSNTDFVTPSSWLQRFMIGDCAVEGVIVAPNMLHIPTSEMATFLSGPDAPPKSHLAKFGLADLDTATVDELNPPLIHRLVGLLTELAFFGPSEEVIAASPPASTYVYRFDRPNGWGPGPFGEVAHHTIDLLYIAGVPKTHPTSNAQKDIEVSEKMIRQWIDFVVGKEPWEATGNEGVQLLFGEDGSMKEVGREMVRSRDFENVGGVTGENAWIALRTNIAFCTGVIRS
ncbi:hypothetical protein ACLOAV_008469 [Pseudogymnoascus australis]